MSDYTPTTDEVRGVYVVHGFRDCHRSAVETEHQSTGGFSAEFDRWLAARDRALREQIARDIEARIDDDGTDEWFAAIECAARIAREGGPR